MLLFFFVCVCVRLKVFSTLMVTSRNSYMTSSNTILPVKVCYYQKESISNVLILKLNLPIITVALVRERWLNSQFTKTSHKLMESIADGWSLIVVCRMSRTYCVAKGSHNLTTQRIVDSKHTYTPTIALLL